MKEKSILLTLSVLTLNIQIYSSSRILDFIKRKYSIYITFDQIFAEGESQLLETVYYSEILKELRSLEKYKTLSFSQMALELWVNFLHSLIIYFQVPYSWWRCNILRNLLPDLFLKLRRGSIKRTHHILLQCFCIE